MEKQLTGQIFKSALKTWSVKDGEISATDANVFTALRTTLGSLRGLLNSDSICKSVLTHATLKVPQKHHVNITHSPDLSQPTPNFSYTRVLCQPSTEGSLC